jgi:hypothetical protein
MEGEYYSLASLIQELLWEKNLLVELGIRSSQPIKLNEDNQGAIAFIKNPTYHGRCKHMDIRIHFIRDFVEKGIFDVVYCSTEDNLADMMTKPLAKVKFARFRDDLNLEEILPSRGSVRVQT